MKRFALLCLGVVLCAPELAHAQRLASMKTGKFAHICSNASGYSVCDAYLGGIADGEALSYLAAHNNGDKNALEGFCIPSDETTAKMRDKVLTWIKAHKDSLEKPVGESVFTALHESYPCSARQ
ncbi:MAG: hypothetical protein IJ934_02210 [Acetobacter sp.]|nr:hypothetical protein [Acetobacter sp.]MBR2123983.1 hypothetical protein [Acetobacter sp.]